jgi:uncharacterized protein (DUF362 family)/Pyruvate/2-oxoacid:ferredoxin oxidoreductase delta subunit
MSKVALVRCESYEYEEVKAAVKRGLSLVGGPRAFIQPGEKILLKPNMLSADSPERCSITHFMVFKAVAETFKNSGAIISYGDSPGIHSPETAARKTGLAAAADELGVTLADFHNGDEVFFKEGIQNKKFIIAKGVLESDGLISLPKLKTHGLARMTGCVKNQFGCIPGTLKGEFHVRLPNVLDFAKMLVDLNRLLKPRLFIMDGIMAMEGNGPRGGTPKKMNMLLFSQDPIALDASVCRIINLNPEFVPTIKLGNEAGLGSYLEKDIEIVGDNVESFISEDFDVKREPVKPFKPGGEIQILRNALVPKPRIDAEKCVRCGVCVNVCPVRPKAVDWHDGDRSKTPSYLYKRCIRCYCCQELCPESAIDLKVPLLRKLVKLGGH